MGFNSGFKGLILLGFSFAHCLVQNERNVSHHWTTQANLNTHASPPVNLQMETDPGSEILYSENQTVDRILTCSNTKPKSVAIVTQTNN